jgi:hypothetical protein
MSFTKLDEVFDIAPAPEQQDPLVVYQEKHSNMPADEQQKEDFDQTRTVVARVLGKIEVALDEMMMVARETEKGRDYEVVGQLAKTLADMTDKLLDVHDRMNKVKKGAAVQNTAANPQVTNQTMNQQNIIFSGSPSEVLEMMKKNKEQK